MKKNSAVYFLVLFILVAAAVSSYFYPRTRDEFYYLPVSGGPGLFQEYYHSYLSGNPRLGQFLANLIGRFPLLKPFSSVLLVVGYASVLFLTIYRRWPSIRNVNDVWKTSFLTALFIFLISQFGEMFYYGPFSTNYTFTHLFYFVYIYIILEYYLFGRNHLERYAPIMIIFALFTGAFNEHVPPVLLFFSGIFAIHFYLKEKRFPALNIILMNIALCIGYLLLFFAPANKIKFKVTGAAEYGFRMGDYIRNWKEIGKIYYYFNIELVVAMVLAAALFVVRYKVISKTIRSLVGLYFAMAFTALVIVAYSPLQGPRLLLFSNTLFIICICFVASSAVNLKKFRKILSGFSTVYLITFFTFSAVVCYKASENYRLVISEIERAARKSTQVEVSRSFDYGGTLPFTRKILLENGRDYIDGDAQRDSHVERLLKEYYHLETISVKK